MAAPYQSVDYLVNKLRESFLINNSDERNVIKYYHSHSSGNGVGLGLGDKNDKLEFPSLYLRRNSPPISFNYKLTTQLNDIDSLKDFDDEDNVNENVSSALGSPLVKEKEHEDLDDQGKQEIHEEIGGSQATVQYGSHQTIKQQSSLQHLSQPKQSSSHQNGSFRKSSGNIIKTNLNKFFKTGNGGSNNGTSNEIPTDDFYDSDQSDETNITNPEYDDYDNNDDDYDDLYNENNETEDDDNNGNEYDKGGTTNGGVESLRNDEVKVGIDEGGKQDSYAVIRDDLTRIDHDNIDGTQEADLELDRLVLDDLFEGDDDSRFLTDSDLTDSDALLVDDSFFGSESSLWMRNNNSSGNLLNYPSSRRGSQDIKRSSQSSLRYRSQTIDKSAKDKRRNINTNESVNSGTDFSLNVKPKKSKSFSSLLALQSPSRASGNDEQQSIKKQKELVKPVLKSNLTLLLKKTSPDNESSVLEYFKFVGDTEGMRPQTVKVYLPKDVPGLESSQKFKISRTASVKDFIGYILLNLNFKDKTDLRKDFENPNRWCLRVVEEDGEVDDDFGPLDRNKPISGFGVEEVLLERVSDREFQENEKLYPLPRLDGNNSTVALNDPNTLILEEGVSETSNLLDPAISDSRAGGITLPSKPTNLLKEKNLEDSQREKFLHKDSTTSSSTNLVSNTSKLKKTMASYKQKSFLSSSSVNNMSRLSMTQHHLHTQQQKQQQQPFDLAGANGLTTSSFLKWTVWRHHQLSFKNRHERSLSIDGEYIYIIPESTAEHENVAYKYLVDVNNLKITSFHVSQIIKCKQSRKYPVNLKIVVLKTTGPKRYDLEALDAIQSEEIVRLINNLVNAYALKSTTTH